MIRIKIGLDRGKSLAVASISVLAATLPEDCFQTTVLSCPNGVGWERPVGVAIGGPMRRVRYGRVVGTAVGRVSMCLMGALLVAAPSIAEEAADARQGQGLKDDTLDQKMERLEAKEKKDLAKGKGRSGDVDVVVLLDATTGWTSNSRIRAAQGQSIQFRIINTSRNCYSFNLVEVEKKAPAPQGLTTALPHNDTVDFRTIHVDTTSAYEVTTTRVSGKTVEQCPYARSWRIAVEPAGWELGFAGAYTFDKLTDPAFALRAGTGANAGLNEVVVEDKQDEWDQGAAAMVHLFHSGGFELGKGVSWAPLSFGLGIGTSESAKYFLGTGLKFGKQAFLTAGVAVGDRDELGQGVEEGDFIAQPNLPLQSRTDSAFFAGVSFSFVNANISQRLEAPFQVATPKPETSEKTDTSGEPKKADALAVKAATAEVLSQFLNAAELQYEVTGITNLKKTGEEVESLTVAFKRIDGAVPSDADTSLVRKKLQDAFPKTKFEVVPKR